MSAPAILLLVLSAALALLGMSGIRRAWSLSRDRSLFVESCRRRTARTSGTVVGGSALTYGRRLRCPLVRFEANGRECLATGPVIETVRRGRGNALLDGTLVLGDRGLRRMRGSGSEFAHAIDAIRESELGGEGVRERWDLDYGDSALSTIYPVGSRAVVAYDPEFPSANSMVVRPDGGDAAAIGSSGVRAEWLRATAEIASAATMAALAISLLASGMA